MRQAARYVSTALLLNISVLLSSTVANAQQAHLLIAAAADLQPLQQTLTKGFNQANGATADFTFAASGSLSQQIEHGAPYDLFLSANELFVKQLAASGKLVPDSVIVYAYGRIALWSKSGRFRSLEDLLQADVRHVAIANPATAPYGVAARDALKHQGLWEKMEPKIVFGDNVAQTFQYAQTGNADAAIVSDSLVYDKGGIVLPSSWYGRISQSAGIVAGSPHSALARRFLQFLKAPAGRKILQGFGFELPQ